MHYNVKISKWGGRLCNNMTQLCNAIFVAEQTRSRLQVPTFDGWLNVHDFDFSGGEPCRTTIESRFFDLNSESSRIGKFSLDWNARRRILVEHIRPMLPAHLFPRSAGEDLVIHIRSGDIFNRARKDASDAESLGFAAFTAPMLRLWRTWTKGVDVHPNFVQPPLSFYKRIIDSRDWATVRIVAEDTENPVIQELIRLYDIRFDEAGLHDDVNRLLAARFMVFGYGTFGITWALLSEHLHGFYTPALPAVALGELRPGDVEGVEVHACEFRNYIPVGQWKATDEQRRLMLTHSVDDVVELEKADTKSGQRLSAGTVA